MSKRKTSPVDPFAQREAEKYANPVPSREFILDFLARAGQPITHPRLCELLQITEEEQVEAVRRRLIAMARDGQLISNRLDAFMPIDKVDLVRGRVQGHRDGYGFVIRSDGGEDIYLHNRQMRKVFDGDEVLARLSGENYRGKEEGAIVEVLVRNTLQIAGRFYNDEGVQFVRPENARVTHDIMVPVGAVGGAVDGQIVVVELTQQPDKNRPPMGRIIHVLGDHMAPGMEIDLAIQSHGIPHVWPVAVEAEAAAIPAEVDAQDKLHRVDVRHLPFVTIDGEDARDFDDAVLCERRKGGWRLYVAIADVSHYVKVDSALDIEARVRGNSVYFPDFVVPMLPEALSNGLCSLNPDVDRLCMVCEINISDKGKITGYQFYEAVMRSHARLTYTQVGEILAQPEHALRQSLHAVVPQLELLHRLYKCLRIARDERGAIDFETVETRIVFNAERKIERIVPVRRNDAHKLIEECMLCANVCAAKFLEKHNLVGLFRVHEGPTEQKLTNLRTFLGELGLGLAGGLQPSSGDFQQLMQAIQGRADSNMIQTVMLRSLRQAMYQVENNGHFGLGYEAYTHFTSPIRRYPDLLVHRAIRSVIRGKMASTQVHRVEGAQPLSTQTAYPYSASDMLLLGEQCSMTERRADEATRDVVSWLKCEFLRDHVGSVFEGLISAVTGFGLFVELKDLYVDGLVHISSLPHDYYRFDPAQHRLVGERTRKVYGLGDELMVRVMHVDLDNRKIDFELETSTNSRTTKKGGASKASNNKSTKASPKEQAKKSTNAKGSAKALTKTSTKDSVKKVSKATASTQTAIQVSHSANNAANAKPATTKTRAAVAEPKAAEVKGGKRLDKMIAGISAMVNKGKELASGKAGKAGRAEKVSAPPEVKKSTKASKSTPTTTQVQAAKSAAEKPSATKVANKRQVSGEEEKHDSKKPKAQRKATSPALSPASTDIAKKSKVDGTPSLAGAKKTLVKPPQKK